MRSFNAVVGVFLMGVALGSGPLQATETELFSVDVGKFVAGFDVSHIVSDPAIIPASFYQMDTTPHVSVPESVEAYWMTVAHPNSDRHGDRIIGKKPVGQAFKGSFYVLRRHPDQPQESTLAKFDFSVDAVVNERPSQAEFARAKGLHFQRLWSEEMAGSAMFRHLAMESLAEIGETARSTGPNWPLRRDGGVDQTIALMSGGRAVSENLQLDQQLPIPQPTTKNLMPLSNVRGISVQAINWSGLVSERPTELDPLSKLIPHDQYAVFLPSFESLTEIIDRSHEILQPAVQWFEPQSRQRDVLSFYQSQLAMPLDQISRLVGNTLIDEIAISGSDPYFRTGTDVTVLMRSDQAELLHSTLQIQVDGIAKNRNGATRTEHRHGNHLFVQWSTPNRSLDCLIGNIGDCVVVTNSLHQMRQISSVADGNIAAMAGLEEYRFFRQRYPRDAANQSALIVVTDAAIRRWCGPQWRIAASRRTRARSSIAEITMRYADELVSGSLAEPVTVNGVSGIPEIGVVHVSSEGVHSPQFGTLDFQTPISEMELSFASNEEIALYEQWRIAYERRWRQAFDPIALLLKLDQRSIHADLTVIPLIVQSQYRSFVQLVGDTKLKPGAGDPHAEAIGQYTMAIDMNSSLLQMARMVMTDGSTPPGSIDVLGWIDDSVTIYFDEDADWFSRLRERSPWALSSDPALRDYPLGVYFPSKDNFNMAAFVVGFRATLQRMAPNMIQWQTVDYKGFQYNRGTVIRGTAIGDPDSMPSLFYVTTGKGLTFSLNQSVIERVVERQLVSGTLDQPHEPVATAPTDVQLSLQTTGRGTELMSQINTSSGMRRMNRIAWSNLPILNYLRFRYPDRDPAQVYQKLFGETLTEPSGGEYVWDPRLRTYVSSLHGYHLGPLAGPGFAPVFSPSDRIETTLSFQNGGLRATLDILKN